jgi:hypothetical protein
MADYWQQKQAILSILRYISLLPIEGWKDDAYWAGILVGTVENDGVLSALKFCFTFLHYKYNLLI